MYDVNVMKSFEHLNNWREEFLIQVSFDLFANATVISLGNENDSYSCAL